MAKQSGLGDYLAVDDSTGSLRAISNDITSITINTPQETLTVTGIDKSAQERIIGLQDFSISLNGVFNAASNMEHDVFKVKSGTRTVTYAIGGNSASNPKLSCEALVSSYDLNRGTDGSLNFTATLELQSGTVPTWTTV
jgi:hypothetical protein